MATIIVTLMIMPDSPEANLKAIQEAAKKAIVEFGGQMAREEFVPIAFGLTAVQLMFTMNEDKGSTESLEDQIKEINEVQSVEVTDVRRTLG